MTNEYENKEGDFGKYDDAISVISVADAAKLLGKNEEFVDAMLRRIPVLTVKVNDQRYFNFRLFIEETNLYFDKRMEKVSKKKRRQKKHKISESENSDSLNSDSPST